MPLSADPIQQQWLWVIIDILLTLGLIGIYVSRSEKLGFLGLMSFAIAMAALSFIGGPDADPFGFSTYEQGAATLMIALIGLSIAWLRAKEKPLAPPLCWFGAALAAGVTIARVIAEKGARQVERQGFFADAGRAGDQISMADAALAQIAPQHLHRPLMASQVPGHGAYYTARRAAAASNDRHGDGTVQL